MLTKPVGIIEYLFVDRVLTVSFCGLTLKVLKAIGLQRTGKQEEAFTLAQEVAALEPTDDNSLQALTILYREMHRRMFFWKDMRE